jgi:bifunctional DNase/RNase
VDARPSDGVAVAVRTGAEIYVEEEVLEKAAIFKAE